MPDDRLKSLLVVFGSLSIFGLLLFTSPGYLSSSSMLATMIGGQILIFAIAKYRQVFFPILLCAFLVAGTGLPYRSEMLRARWILLGVGAVAGFAIYMKDRGHVFSTFHLLALFCVLSALVSASVSDYPQEALLKALSLLLLFVYLGSGVRVGIRGDPQLFFRRVLIGCEGLTYVTALAYLFLNWHFYGNPNSFGAVMGVIVVPMLLWGLLNANSAVRRRMLGVELLLGMLLVISSFARAAMGAAAVACFLVCVASRQYRLLVKGIAAIAVLGTCVIVFVGLPSEVDKPEGQESVSATFLYKGHKTEGVFGSRKAVWEQTRDAIEAHPWFGSGFGTSVVTEDMTKLAYAQSHVDSWVIREHGNSYLAIAEWSGLLGVLPFYALVLLTGLNVRKALLWLYHSRDASSPAIAAAAIGAAGLFNACFEDWMFAVGYYVCVFFWAMMFILVDVLPEQSRAYSSYPVSDRSDQRLGLPVVWVR